MEGPQSSPIILPPLYNPLESLIQPPLKSLEYSSDMISCPLYVTRQGPSAQKKRSAVKFLC